VLSNGKEQGVDVKARKAVVGHAIDESFEKGNLGDAASEGS